MTPMASGSILRPGLFAAADYLRLLGRTEGDVVPWASGGAAFEFLGHGLRRTKWTKREKQQSRKFVFHFILLGLIPRRLRRSWVILTRYPAACRGVVHFILWV